MPSIAFYAHKGGVGKSTLLLDTGFRLATKFDLPVVIIDGDSQVNTTLNLLARNGVPCDDAFMKSLFQNNPSDGPTLYSYLSGAQPQPVFSMDHFLPVAGTEGKMRLLRGSPKLHELEAQLTGALYFPRVNPMAGLTLLNFHKLLVKIKAHYHDRVVILVDLSPSASLVNQCLLLSCDRFVLPCMPDDGSMISLHLLLRYLDLWAGTHTYLHAVKRPPTLLCAVLNRTTSGNALCEVYFRRIAALLPKETPLFRVQDGGEFTKFASFSHLSLFEITNALCLEHGLSGTAQVNAVRHDLHAIVDYIVSAFPIFSKLSKKRKQLS